MHEKNFEGIGVSAAQPRQPKRRNGALLAYDFETEQDTLCWSVKPLASVRFAQPARLGNHPMDILVQTILEKAKWLNSLFHIRYRENARQSGASAGDREDLVRIDQQVATGRVPSYVIIHRSHSNLEPVVREVFEGAEDVQVVVDRRWHERRQAANPVPADRRALPDRRASAPMLDILINLES